VSLWKEVPPPGQGGAFFPPAQKMGDGPVVYGTPATPPFSGCVAPVSSIAIPESSGDDYLVIGQARSAAPGMTFYQKVTVQMIKQFN
jgi:hypothetical protein